MSVVVDALGKQCPIPVVMAKKALAELQTPDTLEILVDNEAAVQNLSKLAASCQLPVRAETTGEKRFSVTMEASAPMSRAMSGVSVIPPGAAQNREVSRSRSVTRQMKNPTARFRARKVDITAR